MVDKSPAPREKFRETTLGVFLISAVELLVFVPLLLAIIVGYLWVSLGTFGYGVEYLAGVPGAKWKFFACLCVTVPGLLHMMGGGVFRRSSNVAGTSSLKAINAKYRAQAAAESVRNGYASAWSSARDAVNKVLKPPF